MTFSIGRANSEIVVGWLLFSLSSPCLSALLVSAAVLCWDIVRVRERGHKIWASTGGVVFCSSSAVVGWALEMLGQRLCFGFGLFRGWLGLVMRP